MHHKCEYGGAMCTKKTHFILDNGPFFDQILVKSAQYFFKDILLPNKRESKQILVDGDNKEEPPCCWKSQVLR